MGVTGERVAAALARQGVDAGALAAAATALPADPAAMADRLLALRAATGVSYLPVAAELADAVAPVIPLLR